MTVQCAYITGYSGSSITLSPLGQTPSDISTCAEILMTGSDYQAMRQSLIDSAAVSAATAIQSQQQAQNQALPFDYAVASQAFAFGFIPVVSLYLTSHLIGVVLKMIRR